MILKLNEKEYNIVDEIDLLTCERYLEYIDICEKVSNETISMSDFNIKYVSIMLDESVEFVKSLTGRDFIYIITELNKLFKK